MGGKGMEGKDKDCLLTLNTFFIVLAKDTLAYLRVKFASVVQERHADLLQPPYLAGVILKALEHTTADISCTHQAVLDLSWKERTRGGGWWGVMSDYPVTMQLQTTAQTQTFSRTQTFICVFVMSPSQKIRLFFIIMIGAGETHDGKYYCVILHRNPSALPRSDMGWCIADRWQITWEHSNRRLTLTFRFINAT